LEDWEEHYLYGYNESYESESFEFVITFYDFYLTGFSNLSDDNFYYDMLDFTTVPNIYMFNDNYIGGILSN